MTIKATAQQTKDQELRQLLKEKAELEGMMKQVKLQQLLKEKAELESLLNQQQSNPAPESPTMGNRLASVGKSGVAGAVGGLADLATAPYNMGAAAHNFQRENIDQDVLDAAARFNPDMPSVPYDVELPSIPSATEAIDSGIDSLTGGYTQTPEGQRWLNEGVKFGASLASPGGLAKAGVKGMSALGTLRPAGLAGAFAAGATGEALRDKGAATSLGGSLGAGIATDLAARRLGGTALKKAGTSLAGFGQKRMNLDAIDAAEKIGIDLPNAAVTDAVIPKYMHTLVSKTPHFGDKLKEQYKTASGKFQESFGKMLDSVGPLKDEEVQALNSKNYASMRKALPREDTIETKDLIETINQLENDLESTFYGDTTTKLMSVMTDIKKSLMGGGKKVSDLPKWFDRISPEAQKQIRMELVESTTVPVFKLLNQKKELNEFLNKKGVWTKENAGTLELATQLQKTTNDLLKQYGETQNPKFLDAWKKADKQFAKVAKRETLEKLLSGKLEDPNTNEVKYKSLVKVLEDRNNQKLLKNTLGTTNYDKLKDFVTVAKSIGSIENLNPSGTAVVTGALQFLKYLTAGDIIALTTAVAEAGSAYYVLTNKKFLNLATQFAKEPTLSRAQKLEKLFQEETGLSMQSLVQSVNKDRKSNK